VDRSEVQETLGLPDLERANANKQLMDDYGWTAADVAREFRVPLPIITSYLSKGRPALTSRIMYEYWDVRTVRFSSTSYDPESYARHWREGNLKFQKEGTLKPAHYPDLSPGKS
jgi:hypothetical protein